MIRKIGKPLLSVVILLLILVGSWYFVFHFSVEDTSNDAIRDTSSIYLKELAEQKVNQISINIEGLTRQLAVTAKNLEINENWELNSVKSFLDNMKQVNEFDFIGLVDVNGMVHTSDRSFSGISRFSFVSEKLKAPKVEFNNTLEEKNLVLVIMPVEGIVCQNLEFTTLVAGLDVDILAERISLVEDETDNICEVVINNGAYIMKNPKRQLVMGSNFLSATDEQAEFDDGYSFIQMKNNMRSGKAGFTSYNMNDIKHFTYYTPVDGTDWVVLSTIHYDAVSDGVNSVRTTLTRNSFIQLVLVVVVFVSIFFLYFSMQKEKNKIKLAQVKAEEKSLAKSDFLSQMSHDIRTPMNAIIGFTNLALKEKDVSPTVRHYHENIAKASNHLLMLINDVLEMTRIESGMMELTESPCNLSDVLRDLEIVIGKQLDEKKQIFKTDVSVKNHFVYCDRLRLNRILLNLLGNSVKYTPYGGRINVTCVQGGCQEEGYGIYEINVSDTGIGMSAEFAKKVFEPFERERSTTVSGIEGTGLGLAIAKKIVDSMDGSIQVETIRGEGSVFTVILKMRLMSEAEIEEFVGEDARRAEQKAAENDINSNSFIGKRVLVAEDNKFNRMILQQFLEEVGFEVESAGNGKVAVEKVEAAEAGYYDVILMDVQMPYMDGYEATRKIRQMDGEKSKVKIIAVTANAFDFDKEAAKVSGMEAHISKPIDESELYEALQRVVDC